MKQLTLTCPVCQSQQQAHLTTHVNTEKHPDQVQALFAGDYFQFECETCGAKRQMAYQFLFHDPKRQFMIFLLPEYRENPEKFQDILAEATAELGPGTKNYQLRVALTVPELIEKIQIFYDGFDDREIELVKILTDGLFAQEKPNVPIQARYYYHPVAKQPAKILYITDSEQILADYHEKLREFIQLKFKSELSHRLNGEFHYIGHQWAMTQLTEE